MSTIPALQSGLSGIQSGMTELNRNADKIASASTSDASNEDIVKPLIDMNINKLQISASAKVVKTADETLGTILDILA